MRRGYSAEYEAKKGLIKNHGKENVIKVAISQDGPDFLIFKPKGRSYNIYGFEVKQTHQKKYYCAGRDKEQFRRLKAWHNANSIPIFYLIAITKHGVKTKWERLTLEEFGERYGIS